MSKYFFCFVFCIVTQTLWGQDSLVVNQLNEKAQKAFDENKMDEALKFSQQAYYLNASQWANLELQSLKIMAKGFRKQGDLPKSLKHYMQILQIDQKKHDVAELKQVNFEIATLYQEWDVHEKALTYFKNIQNAFTGKQELELIRRMAYSNRQLRNYPEALNLYDKLLKKASEKDENEMLALRNTIEIYEEIRNFDKALEYSHQIVALSRKTNPKDLALSLNNTGYLCKRLGKNQEALTYFKESFDIEQSLDVSDTEKMITLSNIGILYQNLKDYKNSVAFLEKAIKLAEKSGQKKSLASLENLLANVYLSMQEYEQAENFNQKAIKTANNDPEVLQVAYLTSSQIRRYTGNFRDALTFYEKSVAMKDSFALQKSRQDAQNLAKRSNVDQTEKEIRLSLVDKEIKQLESQKREQALQLQNQQKDLEIVQLQQKETERQKMLQTLVLEQQRKDASLKEQQIVGLQRDKELQDLVVEQQKVQAQQKQKENEFLAKQNQAFAREQEMQNQLQAQQKKQQTYTYYILVLIGIGLLITFGFLLHSRRQSRLLAKQNNQIQLANAELAQKQEEIIAQSENLRLANGDLAQKQEEIIAQSEILKAANEEIQVKNESLEQQKGLIEKKNEDILASINYAQRIQQAMLPTLASIQNSLPQSFILFKPRDIVSGDFYWFNEVQRQERTLQIIASIDCTGHGVPGAFMSMIGNELLNSIVYKMTDIEINVVLDQLHEGVTRILKQRETSNRDGMDMTMALIDKKNKKFDVSGAKNPYFIIQNNEITQHKVDKMPIGGGDWGRGDAGFTKQSFEIVSPTYLYLFSDGYQDQFGGKEKRKFMIKRMRELVFEIYQKPIAQQHQILDKTIEDWKKEGREEQVDDILFIGMRLD